MKYQNILETIGNTPVVRINRLAPQGVNLFVKVEAFNPLGSVKDRLALGVIEAAEKSGELKPGQTVIEATSGSLAGQRIYYGHVAQSLVVPGQLIAAGEPIAIMGHAGDAASLGHGHIEIGFSDAGGDPLSHHGESAWTPAGEIMHEFLVSLSAAFKIHNG